MQPASGAATMMLKPIMTLEGSFHIVSTPSISYFPDGKRMVSGTLDKTVQQWDLQTGKEIEKARDVHEDGVSMVAVSRDGRWVITVTATGGKHDDGELKACEVETGIVKTFVGHSAQITCIDISMDSSLLASGSLDSTARIWSLETGKLVVGPFKIAHFTEAVRFSQDSKKLAVATWLKKSLEVWDVETQKLDARIEEEVIYSSEIIPPVFWTNKGTILVAYNFSTLTENSANTIYEFDASTLQTVGVPFEGHTKYIRSLALSFDGALLASTSHDSTIKLWALESHQLLASFDVPNPLDIILSPDSRQLAYIHWGLPKFKAKIYICDIPSNILANVGLAVEGHKTDATLGDLLESDATCRPAGVRRIRVIPPVNSSFPPLPRSLSSRDPQQPVSLRRLLNFLRFSSFTNIIPPVQNAQSRDPLDFPATTSLPPNCSPSAQATAQRRSQMDSCGSSRQVPSTTLFSTTAPTTSKTRLLSWRPIRAAHTGHAAPPIVDVPFTRGDERNAAAGAPKGNGGYRRDEDFDPPSSDLNSQQSSEAVQMSSGQHGSGRLCFCF